MTVIESKAYRIDPLGAGDIRHYEQLAAEIYQLLTDEHTLQFLPEKITFDRFSQKLAECGFT
ncbi:hypothetical protein MTO98_16360 [Mucilaginibacter sp. SMC90]|uniref:hypothetical protein n=1 Tax=Mucilaginibacter sp. SMC90 TaxID=2929803 RepID=UPI001FB52A5D|nr:hypothetical protein [Mucilaginibacter sp. SMC90]UOE52645.1 hypothetical protein MTO98_16360 [Mucilaginibacter sp. SMC90]